jgi:hypothetical protein
MSPLRLGYYMLTSSSRSPKSFQNLEEGCIRWSKTIDKLSKNSGSEAFVPCMSLWFFQVRRRGRRGLQDYQSTQSHLLRAGANTRHRYHSSRLQASRLDSGVCRWISHWQTGMGRVVDTRQRQARTRIYQGGSFNRSCIKLARSRGLGAFQARSRYNRVTKWVVVNIQVFNPHHP